MTSRATLLGVSGERYEIDKELQKGSNGKVFSGKRISDGETVAIKCLFEKFDPGHVPLEVSNNLVLQVSKVKGIVHMFDYCIQETGEYRRVAIIFEYMPMDLFDFMTKNRGTEVLLKQIVKKVIMTLLDMHSMANRMHMDVKEENVLIDPETFEVKLCDFGSLASTFHLMTEKIGGTEPFLAPETVRKNQFFPTKSVTWNIGIMTYSLLTDILPWKRYVDQDISKELKYDSKVSTLAKNFVASCLIKNVLRRPDLVTLIDHPWFFEDSDVESNE